MQKIKPYLTLLLIAGLVIIILLQRSCSKDPVVAGPTVEVKYDTIYKNVHDTVQYTVHQTVHDTVRPDGPEYTPGESIDTCKARFEYLLKQHIVKRVYNDTLQLDSLGTIVIIDTVWLNKLGKRIKIYDYKIPFVTKSITITKEKEPVRQLYIGGNLFGDKTKLQLMTPGILYKTKQDHIYQANIGINFDGTVTYGVGAYWKIKLK